MAYLYVHALLFKLSSEKDAAGAFRELADYLDSVQHPSKANIIPLPEETRSALDKGMDECFQEFLKMKEGRVIGSFGVQGE